MTIRAGTASAAASFQLPPGPCTRDGLTGAAPDDTPPWRTLLQSNYLHSVPVGCSERAVCWLLCRLAACRVVPLLLLTPDGPGPLGAL